jgi:hypothetical protein
MAPWLLYSFLLMLLAELSMVVPAKKLGVSEFWMPANRFSE